MGSAQAFLKAGNVGLGYGFGWNQESEGDGYVFLVREATDREK